MQGHRPGKWGRAESSGASWRGVGAPVRALGDPGRLLAAPVLAATQGVCGNDTARAAEIPPPDIGWKVEQLVRDNQWRSIAARLGRMVRRRGGGPAGAEVKQHTDPRRGTAVQRGHMDIQSVQGDTTMGHRYHKGGTHRTESQHITSLHKSRHKGDGGGSNKWFPCTHTTGSHDHTAGQTMTQPVHPITGPHTTTTDDPTLDTHITRTQNES